MTPKDEKLLAASVIALLLIYSLNTQLATLGGYIGFPQFNFGTVTRASDAQPPHYLLRFIAINGEPLTEAIDFENATSWIKDGESKQAHDLINELGIASFADQPAKITRLRGELESLYFDELVSAESLLILRNYSPVGRNTFRPSFSEQVFGRYEFSRATIP